MAFSIYYLLMIYSVFMGIGLVLQLFIGIKSPNSNIKAGWMKFIFFNTIIISFILLFNFVNNSISVIYTVISFGGLLEIYYVTKNNHWKLRTFSIIFYLIIFLLLIRSSLFTEPLFHINTLTLVAVFDGFSQLGGKWLGKRKIARIISPNKTWAGFIVGSISVYLFGLILFYLGDKSLIYYLFLIPLLALIGDLIASYIKRKARVKDFSNVIPYQGGFMDRFDSLSFTVVFVYLLYFV